jgi:spore germination cell wall hydrolase CwlJ-like protein
VTRHLKRGRVASVDRAVPPKDFNAGSILDRQANLLDPVRSETQLTAFVKPAIQGKELDIAMAFHELRPRTRDFGVPVMLASLVTSDTADSLASAYANPEPDYASVSPFDSILTDDAEQRFIPQIRKQDHSWAANILPPSVFSPKEQKCLAEAIYFESANEPLKGQAAVAQVVLNRVRNPTYPGSICGVVYQNEDWRNRCQFSFACDRIPDIVWSRSKFNTAKEIALAVTAGKIYLKDVADSTHYHAVYVRPNWAPTMKKVSKIGLHVFYRTYGGGWS